MSIWAMSLEPSGRKQSLRYNEIVSSFVPYLKDVTCRYHVFVRDKDWRYGDVLFAWHVSICHDDDDTVGNRHPAFACDAALL